MPTTWCVVSWRTCTTKARRIRGFAEAKRRALAILPTMPTGTLIGIEPDEGASDRARAHYLINGEWVELENTHDPRVLAEIERIGVPTFETAAANERINLGNASLIDCYRARASLDEMRAHFAAQPATVALRLADAAVDTIAWSSAPRPCAACSRQRRLASARAIFDVIPADVGWAWSVTDEDGNSPLPFDGRWCPGDVNTYFSSMNQRPPRRRAA